MKRILAVVTICAMVFTCIPGNVFAASKAPVNGGKTVVATKVKKPVQVKKLDRRHLKNGTYKIKGKMLKIDRKTLSMSNRAINHNIILTVKNGKYYVTMDFNGLKVGNKLGYLGKLKYYTNTYKRNKYGNPYGKKYYGKVLTYQKNRAGKFIYHYGKKSPDKVRFFLIPKARQYGWVPLQVFVPIMEKIAPGCGTQNVYLKLDWSTLRK